MNSNDMMIERAKEIIVRDCIDHLAASSGRIKSYLSSKNRSGVSRYIFGDRSSSLSLDDSIDEALKKLVEEKKIVKVRNEFRLKYSFEK